MLGIGRLLAAVLPASKRAAMKIGAEAPMSLKVEQTGLLSFLSGNSLFSEGVCFAESAAYICAALAGAAVVGLALQLLRAKWVSKNVATGAEPKGKRSKKRDSCAFSLVGQGKNREIVELCSGCVETNRLLRQIARDAGMEYDCYEPCTLCKDRVSRLKSLGELGSPAPRARIPFAERN